MIKRTQNSCDFTQGCSQYRTESKANYRSTLLNLKSAYMQILNLIKCFYSLLLIRSGIENSLGWNRTNFVFVWSHIGKGHQRIDNFAHGLPPTVNWLSAIILPFAMNNWDSYRQKELVMMADDSYCIQMSPLCPIGDFKSWMLYYFSNTINYCMNIVLLTNKIMISYFRVCYGVWYPCYLQTKQDLSHFGGLRFRNVPLVP